MVPVNKLSPVTANVASTPGTLPAISDILSSTASVRSIDDASGTTVAHVSTTKKGAVSDGTKSDDAKKIGAAMAQALIAKGIKAVVFDRNGYLYHGRVRALADGAREGGLKF